ncbi:MAG: hypothetical protein J6A74_00640, partial [Oscillospiraceae bacterium]|nr:hypothetical protein [Oscillospiraceae bacterium]
LQGASCAVSQKALRSKCFRLTYPLKTKAFYHIPDKKKAVSERVIICYFLTIGGFFDTLRPPKGWSAFWLCGIRTL